jgi:hypothetical protein
MKKATALLVAILLTVSAISAPNNKAKSNGNWASVNTWSLNRLPQAGDTITIPSNFSVIINNDQTINGFVYLQVAGTLDFQNNSTSLKLGNTSVVTVLNGRIKGNGNPSQKLRIGNSTVFDGNDADITGFQMANGSSNGFVGMQAPLPVHFIAFTLLRKSNDVWLQWSTMTEQGVVIFEIERSLDGRVWETVGSVPAAGNSQSIQQYSFTDRSISANTIYYRVKQVNNDLRYSYTPVKTVKADVTGVSISAASGAVVLQFAEQVKSEVSVKVINYAGQVISEKRISKAYGQVVLSTNQKGSYIVAVTSADGIQASRQVML